MTGKEHIYYLGLLITFYLCSSAPILCQLDTTLINPELIGNFHEPKGNDGKICIRVLSKLPTDDFIASIISADGKNTEIWTYEESSSKMTKLGVIPGIDWIEWLDVKFRGGSLFSRKDSEMWLVDCDKKEIRRLFFTDKYGSSVEFASYCVLNDYFILESDTKLYASDGNSGGTHTLFGENQLEQSLDYMIESSVRQDEFKKVYFLNGADSGDQLEIWSTDGTTKGTKLFSTLPLENYGWLLFSDSWEEGVLYTADSSKYFLYGNNSDPVQIPIPIEQFPYYNSHFFDGAYYWYDDAISSTVKFEKSLIEVCPMDSLSHDGWFKFMGDSLYWLESNGYEINFGYKLNVSTCEKSPFPDSVVCRSESFYVIEDNDSVFVYSSVPGKRKVPLKILNGYSNRTESNPEELERQHGMNGNITKCSSDYYLIETSSYSKNYKGNTEYFLVNGVKNTFRKINIDLPEQVNNVFVNDTGIYFYLSHANGDASFFMVKL